MNRSSKTWLILAILFIPSMSNSMEKSFERHDDQEKTDLEFDNVFRHAQDQQFTLINSTPNASDMKEGQMLILSTGTKNPVIILRFGTSTYYWNTTLWK